MTASIAGLPAAFWRGGTSKAVIFDRSVLPEDKAEWEPLFLSVMGSPDPNGRQLDGMGGGASSLSKIGVVALCRTGRADLEWTFAQVGIDRATIGWRGTCGNISAAIAPYALDTGLVRAEGVEARIRILNTNTDRAFDAIFPLQDGVLAPRGDARVDGVSGSAAPVRLEFLSPGGATTGRLLPTGKVADRLPTPRGPIDASIVDAANPLVAVRARDVLGAAPFSPDQLDTPEVLGFLNEVRVAAAATMGLVRDEDEARTKVTNLPLVAVVRPPEDFLTRSGYAMAAERIDLLVQVISAGLAHKAVPLTGAMALSVAGAVEGSLVHEAMRKGCTDLVRIGHPSGSIELKADCVQQPEGWEARSVTVLRTARKLFDGRVWPGAY